MSADRFKLKRGTTAQVAAYLPQVGEPVYDITLKRLTIGDGITLGGVPPSNSLTADKLSTARIISANGAITGSSSFDGSSDITISTTLSASPALTGTPTTPTAPVDTNSTQVASTAFVVGQASSALPLVDGSAAIGVSLRYSRQDHVHPTDTSRAPLASPAFTGVPTAPTASIGTNTTQLATMAALQARILGTVSQTAGVPTGTIIERGSNANGEYVKYADGTMIATFNRSLATQSISTALGSLFYGTQSSGWTFPVAFIANPSVTSVVQVPSQIVWSSAYTTLSTTSASFYVLSGVSLASVTVNQSLMAIGRWF